MAILLNGTTQYVASAAGDNIGATTHPLSIFALVNTASLRTAGAWNGIISYGDFGDSGCVFEIEAAAALRLYFGLTDAGGLKEAYSSFSLVANTGWWLVGVCWASTGNRYFYAYRYSTLALSTGTGGGASTSTGAILNPGLEPALIGAAYDAAVIDFYPGAIGWVGVWRRDVSDAGLAVPPQVMELVTRGPWGMIEPFGSLKLVTFYSFASKNGTTCYNLVPSNPGVLVTMTTTGSPALTYGGPAGELPPWGVIPVLRAATVTPPSPGGGASGGLRRLFLPLRRRLV